MALLVLLSGLPALADDAAIDPTLDALDKQGKNLKEFTAKVKMSQTDAAFGTDDTWAGNVAFQKKSEGDARIHVIFDQQIRAKIAVPNKKEYLLDKGILTDRDYPKKIEVNRQVLREGEKINLLKLGEGPFPLPIGQSKEDVHKNFDVTLIPPAKDDPAGTTHLKLDPKKGTALAPKFKSLEIWVDQKLQMPVRIDTLDAAGTEQRRTDLTEIKINPPGGLKPADFQLPPIDERAWSRKTELMDK